jgi:hypothetical protein
MPGRPNYPHRYWRLASGSQLWRLNQLGRLQVVDEVPPLSSAEAKKLIRAELEKFGEPFFPGTGLARHVAEIKETAEGQ